MAPLGSERMLARVRQTQASTDRAIEAYLALPPLPITRNTAVELAESRQALDRELAIALAAGGTPLSAQPLLDAIDHTDGLLRRLSYLEAGQASDEASAIEHTWRRSEVVQLSLAALGLLLAALAAIVSLRAIRRYTRHLERRSLELEQFAGRVAHDVQSPLSAVSLAMGLLHPAPSNGESPEPGRDRELADRALASLKRVHSIVEGLLDFARSGAEPDPTAGADVGEVLAGVLAELSAPAEAAGITLESTEPSSCRVRCTTGILASLLSNLVRNAIQHMGPARAAGERRITVRARVAPERVRVEVEDTGPGVPPGWEELVFEPYLRAPGRGKNGIGLGLATVKRLVEAHAGEVGYERAASGGARFWFELPCAADCTEVTEPAGTTIAA